MRNSKRRIKYHYEIEIGHFKLKNFINRLIPSQGHAFFAFTIQNLQQYNTALWTMDTLLVWKDHLTAHK